LLSVADSKTLIELSRLNPSVMETAGPSVLALTTWDMSMSQFRKLFTGSKVKTVCMERQAPSAPVGSSSVVEEPVNL